MARRLVIFADGTGNAFQTQASNVWRLYCALDSSDSNQVARYIRGVGTSSFRPYALLDGVTGIGVPANVRELYRFLCWSWREGDEILMFGFSRGAFTIRTLIGLIDREGLVPVEIGGRRVSRDEMARNAMAAWRSYRSRNFEARWWMPSIALARGLRDAVLAGWGALTGRPRYAAIAAETEAQGRKNVRITYVGLFDTVEAYGVPLDELRSAIDAVLWPLSFRNQRLSEKVERARHALALDDERRTFHPVRFDLSQGGKSRIEELWFAGAHSDVGGGYPDGSLSLVPLCWIADGAKRAGLRFEPGALEGFQEAASPYGPRHDSRRGLAMFYRYAPRRLEAENGREPVVHRAVLTRMLWDRDAYAPLTLKETGLVAIPGGPPKRLASQPGIAADARLISAVRNVIWWRSIAYWLLLATAGLLAALPALGPRVSAWLAGREAAAVLVEANRGASAGLDEVWRAVAALVPGYAVAWAEAVVAQPLLAGGLVALFAALYRWNSRLAGRASDLARAAWVPMPGVARPSTFMVGTLRAVRRWGGWALAHAALTRAVLPVALGVAVAAVLGVAVSRLGVAFTEARQGEAICPASTQPRAPSADAAELMATRLFPADALCWGTGIAVEKGRAYVIRIEQQEAFFDRTYMSGVGGFASDSWVHRLALPIRRLWGAEWFQPVLRVGPYPGADLPLLSHERGAVPQAGAWRWDDTVPGKRVARAVKADDCVGETPKERSCGVPAPAALDGEGRIHGSVLGDAQKFHKDQHLDRVLEARFVAPVSGELFLYLNDAVYWTPWGGIGQIFYANNRGTARISVRLPLPE